ncbi:MAG: Zn-ribbon containing protein [Nanoarchaeota archaeon]
MPHQCVKCSRIIPLANNELLSGCKECGGKFFFYIKDDQFESIRNRVVEIPEEEKDKIEQDVREMAGITEADAPVILDLESIRITGDAKFELDIVKLFHKNRPLIYKLEEGKYIIDLSSTLRQSAKDIKEIRNPDEK